MIKGLILDVDGVLIGGKEGYNWPNPNKKVIKTLKNLRKKGLNISLCTGKGTFAIKNIVESAELDNLHIGDGGAVVVDYIHNKVIDEHNIPYDIVNRIVDMFQENEIYLEIYTRDGYFIEKRSVCDITTKHSAILYKEPFVVESLIDTLTNLKVVKIMPVAKDEKDRAKIIDLFQKMNLDLSVQWGIHPTALPCQFGIITEKNISKKQAAEVISKCTNIELTEMLGIGDTIMDWQFMSLCGFAGAMGNATQELKQKVDEIGDRGFIGKSVDENGVIDILKHFSLV